MRVATFDFAAELFNLAVVEIAEQGKAVELRKGKQRITVFKHSRGASYLKKGDEVIYLLHQQGAIILDAIRQTDEFPQQGFNIINEELELQAASKPIHIASGNSLLQILPNGNFTFSNLFATLSINTGCITLQAQQIQQQAENSFALTGYPITLNQPK